MVVVVAPLAMKLIDDCVDPTAKPRVLLRAYGSAETTDVAECNPAKNLPPAVHTSNPHLAWKNTPPYKLLFERKNIGSLFLMPRTWSVVVTTFANLDLLTEVYLDVVVGRATVNVPNACPVVPIQEPAVAPAVPPEGVYIVTLLAHRESCIRYLGPAFP